MVPEAVTRDFCLFRRIHQAQIDNFCVWRREALCNPLNVRLQPLLQSFELRPIPVEPYSEEPHCEFVLGQLIAHARIDSGALALRTPLPVRCDSILKSIY